MRKLAFFMPTWDLAVASMMDKAGHDCTAKGTDPFDVLLLVGGPDVNPALYKQPKLPDTYPNLRREAKDLGAARTVAKDKPKVGICYGGQLLNCISGGRMWQHVQGHRGTFHPVKMLNGDIIQMNSTHHQMMIPSNKGVVLGKANVATKKISPTLVRHHCDPNAWEDVEIVWYANTKSLCFQPHPEYPRMEESGGRERFFQLIDNFIVKSLDGDM